MLASPLLTTTAIQLIPAGLLGAVILFFPGTLALKSRVIQN